MSHLELAIDQCIIDAQGCMSIDFLDFPNVSIAYTTRQTVDRILTAVPVTCYITLDVRPESGYLHLQSLECSFSGIREMEFFNQAGLSGVDATIRLFH